MFTAIYDKLSSMEDELRAVKHSNELLQKDVSDLRNELNLAKEFVATKEQIVAEINNNVHDSSLKTKINIGFGHEGSCYVDKNITYRDFVNHINKCGKGETGGTFSLDLFIVKEHLQNIREIDLADVRDALKRIMLKNNNSMIVDQGNVGLSVLEYNRCVRRIFCFESCYGYGHSCFADYLKHEFGIGFRLGRTPLWTA